MKLINFLQENISWIKDFMMLLFAATGTVITILTYKRARATILQPIRNEVIKKQSELLCEILKICQPLSKIDNGIDYVHLVQVNVISYLRDFGFIFNKQPDVSKQLEEDITGWIPCGDSQILNDIEIIGAFGTNKNETQQQMEWNEFSKKKYDEAKKGNVQIDKIFITKTHAKYMEKLNLLSANPFMPKSIQAVLNQIIMDVNYNLTKSLKSALKEFILDFFTRDSTEEEYPNFSPSGVYNDFNHKRIHHRSTINELIKASRSYLRIDDSWE